MTLRSGRIVGGTPDNRLADKLAREELAETSFMHGPTKDLPIVPYDGLTNFELFFERFLLIKDAKNWTDDEAAKWFPLCLQTVPLAFYRTLKDDVKQDLPTKLKAAFKKEFVNTETRAQNLNRLAVLRQAQGETVNDFYQRLLGLAYNAYDSSIDPSVRDSLSRSHFINGLHEDMAVQLRIYAPDSLREAVRMANNLEAARVLSKPMGSLQITSSTNGEREPVSCYFCGRKGHLQRDCYLKQRSVGMISRMPAKSNNNTFTNRFNDRSSNVPVSSQTFAPQLKSYGQQNSFRRPNFSNNVNSRFGSHKQQYFQPNKHPQYTNAGRYNPRARDPRYPNVSHFKCSDNRERQMQLVRDEYNEFCSKRVAPYLRERESINMLNTSSFTTTPREIPRNINENFYSSKQSSSKLPENFHLQDVYGYNDEIYESFNNFYNFEDDKFAHDDYDVHASIIPDNTIVDVAQHNMMMNGDNINFNSQFQQNGMGKLQDFSFLHSSYMDGQFSNSPGMGKSTNFCYIDDKAAPMSESLRFELSENFLNLVLKLGPPVANEKLVEFLQHSADNDSHTDNCVNVVDGFSGNMVTMQDLSPVNKTSVVACESFSTQENVLSPLTKTRTEFSVAESAGNEDINDSIPLHPKAAQCTNTSVTLKDDMQQNDTVTPILRTAGDSDVEIDDIGCVYVSNSGSNNIKLLNTYTPADFFTELINPIMLLTEAGLGTIAEWRELPQEQMHNGDSFDPSTQPNLDIVYVEDPESYEIYRLNNYCPMELLRHASLHSRILDVSRDDFHFTRVEKCKTERYEGHLFIVLNANQHIEAINGNTPETFAKKLIQPLYTRDSQGNIHSWLNYIDIDRDNPILPAYHRHISISDLAPDEANALLEILSTVTDEGYCSSQSDNFSGISGVSEPITPQNSDNALSALSFVNEWINDHILQDYEVSDIESYVSCDETSLSDLNVRVFESFSTRTDNLISNVLCFFNIYRLMILICLIFSTMFNCWHTYMHTVLKELWGKFFVYFHNLSLCAVRSIQHSGRRSIVTIIFFLLFCSFFKPIGNV